ncbi:MAG: lipopolysaccharide biosynthesis protein [Desulforegulaceae bacterium]|nr:lipopolysaccharide biosynthesis protein [Desulforegulaceae bacterium]
MTLASKLKSAAFWQTLQIVIQVVAQFAYIATMARLLSKNDFGLMAMAGSFIGIGTIFSEGGMGAALIQRKNITQKHMNAALQGGFVIGFAIFIMLFFSANIIALFFNQPQLEFLIKVIGVNVVLHSISGISISLLEKEFQFKYTASITMVTSVIGYTVGILCGYHNLGVWSLVVASLTTTLLSTIAFFSFAPIKFSFKLHVKEWKELFSFGFGIILLKINNYMGNEGIILVLGKIFTPGLLGVFERAFRIKTLPSMYLGNILDKIMFPAMSEIQDEHDRLFRIYQNSLGVVNSVLMPLAVFLVFFSKEVVLIILGNNWLEAVFPLQIMFIVLPFSSSSRMADSVIRAKGLVYKNSLRKFIYVIFLLVTVSIGAYYFGIVGASIAVSISFLFNYTIMLVLVKRIFNKGIREIFFSPVFAGLKISLVILIIIYIFSKILNGLNETPLSNFFIISLFTCVLIAFIAWKNPKMLGKYLCGTINQVFIKTKS